MSDTILLVSSALGAVVLIVFLVIHLLKNKNKAKKSKIQSSPLPPPMSSENSSKKEIVRSNDVNTGSKKQEPNSKKDEQKLNEQKPKNQTYEVSSEKTYGEFIKIFPKFNMNPQLIKKYLLELDYDEIDKGQLKTFLEHKGIAFNIVEEIINALQTKYIQKQNINIIEDSISHYKNLGWNDSEIREHFFKEGYSSNLLDGAFKEFYKRNIYNKYVQNIVNHIKPFLRSGKDDSFIQKTFLDHKWPKELIDDALEKAKEELKEEESTKLLEESILKIILTGDKKDCFAKIIAKKDWPEDDLKKEYENIKKGYDEFEKSLKNLDLNEYNKEKIKKSLITKNWPDKLASKILINLVEKVEYHRKILNLEKHIFNQIESGFFSSEDVNSQIVKDKLIAEGWNGVVIKKLIDKINRDLLIKGEKDKVKEFNSHVFKKQKYKELKDVISNFEIKSTSTIDDSSKQILTQSQNNK